MTDDMTPQPVLSIRRWLLNTVLMAAAIFGGLFVLAALFLAEGILPIGKDPAIPDERTLLAEQQAQTDKLVQRLEFLEKSIQHSSEQHKQALEQNLANETIAGAVDDALLQRLEHTAKETAELKEQLAALQEQQARFQPPQEESRLARMVAGLTQLKTAYENDMSLRYGIANLQASTEDVALREKLNQLQKLLDEKLPSRQDILSSLESLKQDPESTEAAAQNLRAQTDSNAQDTTPQQDGNNADTSSLRNRLAGTLEGGWRSALGRFVQVKPAGQEQQETLLGRIENAVQTGNYSLAETLAAHLPMNPKTELLLLQLKARAKVQRTVNTVVTKTTTLIGSPNSKGALY